MGHSQGFFDQPPNAESSSINGEEKWGEGVRLLGELRQRALDAADSHSPRWDSFLYNGSTVTTLVATAAATFLPFLPGFAPPWLPQVLTGLAFFLIVLESQLHFGGRWRFHRKLRHGYCGLADVIDVLIIRARGMTAEDLARECGKLGEAFQTLRALEGEIPGIPSV